MAPPRFRFFFQRLLRFLQRGAFFLLCICNNFVIAIININIGVGLLLGCVCSSEMVCVMWGALPFFLGCVLALIVRDGPLFAVSGATRPYPSSHVPAYSRQ